MIEPIAKKSKHAALTAQPVRVRVSCCTFISENSPSECEKKKEWRERACRVARLEEKSLIETRDIRGKY